MPSQPSAKVLEDLKSATAVQLDLLAAYHAALERSEGQPLRELFAANKANHFRQLRHLEQVARLDEVLQGRQQPDPSHPDWRKPLFEASITFASWFNDAAILGAMIRIEAAATASYEKLAEVQLDDELRQMVHACLSEQYQAAAVLQQRQQQMPNLQTSDDPAKGPRPDNQGTMDYLG
ncbi:MAG: hypothetical protein EOO40_08305 [Deltaproteobacteria bacterium]|nr:MAG: hypothetical protein EOO40_08305 [Deltaproteobacteria bacterium]